MPPGTASRPESEDSSPQVPAQGIPDVDVAAHGDHLHTHAERSHVEIDQGRLPVGQLEIAGHPDLDGDKGLLPIRLTGDNRFVMSGTSRGRGCGNGAQDLSPGEKRRTAPRGGNGGSGNRSRRGGQPGELRGRMGRQTGPGGNDRGLKHLARVRDRWGSGLRARGNGRRHSPSRSIRRCLQDGQSVRRIQGKRPQRFPRQPGPPEQQRSPHRPELPETNRPRPPEAGPPNRSRGAGPEAPERPGNKQRRLSNGDSYTKIKDGAYAVPADRTGRRAGNGRAAAAVRGQRGHMVPGLEQSPVHDAPHRRTPRKPRTGPTRDNGQTSPEGQPRRARITRATGET